MVIPALVCISFSFAAGIFSALSMIERPVWRLMLREQDGNVSDSSVRWVHGQLSHLTHYLPPIMKTTMLVGGVALVLQSWFRGFDGAAIAVLATFLVGITFLVSRLQRCIDGVAKTEATTSDIRSVRSGTGQLAKLHHLGLIMAITVLILQLTLVMSVPTD